MPPFFSVILPTYNQDKFLLKSLDSLSKQTFEDFETIIIDNHSIDNTEKISESFRKKKIYKKIRNNGIIAKSRNEGIKLSEGKWLAFLDADDLWTYNKLEEVYNNIKKYKFDVFCNSEWIITDKVLRKKLWIYGHYGKFNFYKKLIIFGNCLSTSASVVNKDFLQKKKIFYNENKEFVTSEDYEFFLNIAINGGKFHFYNKPLGYHTFHEESASSNRKKHLKSIIEVQKFHIFHKQNFTFKKENLWNYVKKINSIQERIKNLKKNKNSKFFEFFSIFTIFIFTPLKFVKIIYLFLKKNFLQKIYFIMYK